MDPNQAWSDFHDAVLNRDLESAKDFAEALSDWLKRGGFPPTGYTRKEVEQALTIAMNAINQGNLPDEHGC